MSLRNLDDLSVFVQVLDHHSFSAAARTLQRTPKTISKQIARLEQALGVPLFERNTRHLRITEEGLAIAARARLALNVLDEVQELARGGSRELRGTIRLTAPTPFGRKFVAPAIGDFRQLHPGVNFDLRLSDRVQDLYRDDLDLAVRIGELADSRLVAQRLALNRRVLAASPAYLQAHGWPARPEDLARHQCLVFAYPGLLQTAWPLHNGHRETTITIGGQLYSDSGDVLHAWCRDGLGISLRETWDIHEQLRDGRLLRVLPDWEGSPSQISLVRARRAPVPRRLTEFSEFLRERWRSPPWEAA